MKSLTMLLACALLCACRGDAPDPVVPQINASASAGLEASDAAASAANASGPSFDCSKAASDIEQRVCADPALALLDRQLAAEFEAAVAADGADREQLAATQRGWIAGRNDCWKSGDQGRCVLESYQTQLVQLKLNSGRVLVPAPVEYLCDDRSKPLTAVFYNDLEPKAAVITWGSDQAIAFPQPAASGARYGREGLDFWEHQGEVNLDFWGNKLRCKPAPQKVGRL